jgi:hypothetical protein
MSLHRLSGDTIVQLHALLRRNGHSLGEFAVAGEPAGADERAWRTIVLTHRRTGVARAYPMDGFGWLTSFRNDVEAGLFDAEPDWDEGTAVAG